MTLIPFIAMADKVVVKGHVYDENKQPIVFQDTFAEESISKVEDTEVLEVTCKMPAMLSDPKTIYLVPYNENSSAEKPLWEYALTIECNKE